MIKTPKKLKRRLPQPATSRELYEGVIKFVLFMALLAYIGLLSYALNKL